MVMFALLVALLGLNAVFSRAPSISGDGREYFMMSRGFLERGSPALHSQDLVALARLGDSVGFVEEALRAPKLEWFGYFPARNGKQYCYHFWLYSLVNVPALAASRFFGFSPLRSFLVTNSLLIVLAAFILLFKTNLPAWARAGVLLMFLGGGATFYLDWTGPEIFSASLVVIGISLLLSHRPLLAALAFAAAAQQNPPIAPLVAASLAFWLWRCVSALKDRKETFRTLARQVFGVAAIVALALMSPLFYWNQFDTPSLLVAHGSSEAKFITTNRLLSYYFDFDQGLMRGAPFLLGSLFFSLLIALARPAAAGRWILGGLGLMAASVAIALPSLTTVTWVAGCRVFLRYALWGAIPLWFATVILLHAATPRQRTAILGVALACQFAWIAAVYRGSGAEVSFREHSWLTRQVIRHFPEHYNPDPFIFAVRAVRSWVLPFQPAPGMIYYYEHPGRISKLMYHTEGRANWIPECAATPADLEKAPGIERIRADGGWSYLNLGNACPLQNGHPDPALWLGYQDRYSPIDAKGVSFVQGSDWEPHVWENQTGWGKAEDWGVWTDGESAHISFLLPQPPGGPMALTLTGIGRPAQGQTHQECDVYVNGIFTGVARFVRDVRSTATLPLSPELLARSSGIFHVRMQMHDDGRAAVGMISINLEPGPARPATWK